MDASLPLPEGLAAGRGIFLGGRLAIGTLDVEHLTWHAQRAVVDDEPMIRSLLAEFGGFAGVGTVFAETGEQAVEACRGRRFAVVFLDLLLPGINGVEVMARVKELQPETPIVIMTGHLGHPLIDQATELGPMAVMHKPFALEEVQGILQSIAAQRS